MNVLAHRFIISSSIAFSLDCWLDIYNVMFTVGCERESPSLHRLSIVKAAKLEAAQMVPPMNPINQFFPFAITTRIAYIHSRHVIFWRLESPPLHNVVVILPIQFLLPNRKRKRV